MKKSNAIGMPEAVKKMGQELNRDIVEQLKEVKNDYTEESYKDIRKKLNKERIKALGFTLIQGGKAE